MLCVCMLNMYNVNRRLNEKKIIKTEKIPKLIVGNIDTNNNGVITTRVSFDTYYNVVWCVYYTSYYYQI